jgi:cytochrome P450
MTVTPTIDLLDPASFAHGHPHDQYRWLRRHDPVHWHEEPDGPGFWAVTRYADVQTVSRDPKTFSSWEGGVMITDGAPELLAGSRLMMLYMDPPDHTRYRLLVNKGFTPRGASAWADRIGDLAGRIVDEVIEQGECDLVTALAGEMPSYVIAELMGIPLDDGRRLYELTEIMHSADASLTMEERLGAVGEMHAYATSVAETKRRDPKDDLATLLVQAEVDGGRLSDEEFNWFFLLLVNAGGDTTRNLVAGGIEALFHHPAERDRFAANPAELMPTAVEELLRYVSPVVHMRRTATRDFELAGTPITAGQKVVVFYAAANRDEAIFGDPDRLDLGRTPNPHIAFGGGGPHFCLGAHFARLETSAILAEIFTRMPDLEPTGLPERLVSNFIAGPRRFPVRFTPGPRRQDRRRREVASGGA